MKHHDNMCKNRMRKNNTRTKHSTKHAKRTRSRIRVPGDDGRRNLRQDSQQDRKSETLRTHNKQIPATGNRMNQE